MKKTLLLTSAALFCGLLPVSAEHLNADQALARVQKTAGLKRIASKTGARPTLNSTIGNLYIFSTPSGYIVLPNDDAAPALLGYSDDGTFSLENNPALSYWLEFYNRELDYLSKHPNNLSSSLKAASRTERAPIEPLTQTKWNQEAPYNDKCPELNGERSVTGCVATAMAQVMKYHNYPTKGKGTHSYDWESGGEKLSFNYGETTFDWANMPNIYDSSSTQTQRDAVATLMLACGISVNMNYSPNESGASTMLMGSSLIDYFDYDQALWMPMRDYYGIEEWEDMIYKDLSEGLPVLYAGQGTAGGHQFICDGYSSDGYFHFNWGWGGMSNGYFLLTALNPASLGVGGGSGGFNSYQQIALGVRPPVSGSQPTYLMYCTSDFLPVSQQAYAGEDMEASGGFYSYSMKALPKEAAIGMRIVSADGTYDRYLESESAADLPSGYGFSSEAIVFPALPDGEYTITPAFYDGKNWSEMRTPVGQIGSIIANVSDNVATLSSSGAASVSVSDIVAPDEIYINRDFPLSFTITNTSDEEYIGKIIPLLVDQNGNTIAQSVYRPVDIIGGATENITDYVGKFTAEEGAELTPGSYMLVFVNESGNALSNPIEVTLAADPGNATLAITSFSLKSDNPITDKEKVEFNLGINCTAGYFSGSLRVVVFPDKYGNVSSVAIGSTPIAYLMAGESKELTTSIDLSNLSAGNYMAAVYNGNTQMTDMIRFEISTSTGIEEISVEDQTAEQIYNLQGVKCNRPLSPGFYIINGRKTLVR